MAYMGIGKLDACVPDTCSWEGWTRPLRWYAHIAVFLKGFVFGAAVPLDAISVLSHNLARYFCTAPYRSESDRPLLSSPF